MYSYTDKSNTTHFNKLEILKNKGRSSSNPSFSVSKLTPPINDTDEAEEYSHIDEDNATRFKSEILKKQGRSKTNPSLLRMAPSFLKRSMSLDSPKEHSHGADPANEQLHYLVQQMQEMQEMLAQMQATYVQHTISPKSYLTQTSEPPTSFNITPGSSVESAEKAGGENARDGVKTHKLTATGSAEHGGKATKPMEKVIRELQQ